MRPTPLEQDIGCGMDGVQPRMPEQGLTQRRLRGRQPRQAASIVAQHEPGDARAQVAASVEDEDRAVIPLMIPVCAVTPVWSQGVC